MSAVDTLKRPLQDAIASANLAASMTQQQTLLRFIDALSLWNKRFNLTGIRDSKAMLSTLIMDSLVVLPYLQGTRLLDVGCGAGFPGLPLAICCPEREWVLLDSNGKKTRFLQQMCMELALDNVQVVSSRVEHYRSEAQFDVILTRAFATLGKMASLTRHLCADKGVFLALKGRYPEEELQALPQGVALQQAWPLMVPGLSRERHLIQLAVSE